ncbi:MAG TPA: hypothetical protein VNV42_03630 [Solirubrobacteraceae bacterium]|jgi:hypothetical protein|nr:hypothetical protein [Solirubrobacteraceae bacterium]
MSDTSARPEPSEPPYHLHLAADERPVAASALRLLIADEAHLPDLRALAREALAGVDGSEADERRGVTLTLSPPQMKIAHTALRSLLNDLRREQHDERDIVRRILDKLPDEHTMRAIELN